MSLTEEIWMVSHADELERCGLDLMQDHFNILKRDMTASEISEWEQHIAECLESAEQNKERRLRWLASLSPASKGVDS